MAGECSIWGGAPRSLYGVSAFDTVAEIIRMGSTDREDQPMAQRRSNFSNGGADRSGCIGFGPLPLTLAWCFAVALLTSCDASDPSLSSTTGADDSADEPSGAAGYDSKLNRDGRATPTQDGDVPIKILGAPSPAEIEHAFAVGGEEFLGGDGSAKVEQLGVFVKAGVDLSDGRLDYFSDGIRWQMRVDSPGATFMVPNFGAFDIGNSGILSVYPTFLGSPVDEYRSSDAPTGILWTRPVVGDSITLEIWWPGGEESDPSEALLSLDQIAFGVVDLLALLSDVDGAFQTEASNSGSSQLGGGPGHCDERVRCYPDPSVQIVRRGVVFIAVSSTNFQGGSGSFINNTDQSCRPYVLTAEHVIPGVISPASATFRHILLQL